MSETKTVRVRLDTAEKMKLIRSPGETDGELIDRAVSLLAEIKTLFGKLGEAPDYQEWLQRQKKTRFVASTEKEANP